MAKTPPDRLGEISADPQILKEFRDTLQVLIDDAYESLHDTDEGRNHSEDEVETGTTWIDGKPIYRKVVTLTTASSPTTTTWISTNDSVFLWGTNDVDEVIKSSVRGFDSTGNTDIVLPHTNGTDVVTYQHDYSNFGFKSKVTGTISFPGMTKITGILEYTKTTDTV